MKNQRQETDKEALEVASQEVGEILDRLDAEDTPTQSDASIKAAMYAGPLPPPQMLEQYEATLPGMANRIMSMAEKEQKIRSRDNGWLVFNDFARVFGSILVSLGLVGGAIYCGVIGEPLLGIALAASGLIPQIIRHYNGKEN